MAIWKTIVNIYKALNNFRNKLEKSLDEVNKNINEWKKNTEKSLNEYRENAKRRQQLELEKSYLELEKTCEKVFIEYKNNEYFTNIYYTLDYIDGKLSEEEYDKKMIQYQEKINQAIVKVENKKMTYQEFTNLVYGLHQKK